MMSMVSAGEAESAGRQRRYSNHWHGRSAGRGSRRSSLQDGGNQQRTRD